MSQIDPGAYTAYQACLDAQNSGVRFQMLSPVTRDVLELIVNLESNVGGEVARLSWSASAPVTCEWLSEGREGRRESTSMFEIGVGRTVRLRCHRMGFDADPVIEPDFVNVIRDGGRSRIHIPWRKYRVNGTEVTPYPTLQEIQEVLESKVDDLRQEISDLRRIVDTLAVDVSDPDLRICNTVYEAEISGIVTASAQIRKYPDRVSLSGWISLSQEQLQTDEGRKAIPPMAYDVASYVHDNANLPYASITMAVDRGQYWYVHCDGDQRVMFQSIDVNSTTTGH
ncbi:MAG: hypothetical protein OXH99_01225 [Bryobacterales bacterium]|nr:hypothetical protein [Bryobacterales bacterium]